MDPGVHVIGIMENGICPAGEVLQGVLLLGDPRSAHVLLLFDSRSPRVLLLFESLSPHVLPWLLYHVACCNNIRLMEFFPIHVPLGVGEESTRRKKKVVTHGKDKNSRDGQGIAVMAKE